MSPLRASGKSAGQAGAVRGVSVDCSPATDVAVAAQLACLLEASVAKPGNVSPDRSFADLRYEDFLAGAAAIGVPLAAAGSRPLGLTIRAARDEYAAIRRAAPGGLGTVDDQDVADEPTQTLVEVLRLAAGRDSIAREYATAFELTFVTGVPALERARRDGLSWPDAIVETFL